MPKRYRSVVVLLPYQRPRRVFDQFAPQINSKCGRKGSMCAKQHRRNFKSRVLEAHPDYADHWCSLPKSSAAMVNRFCVPSPNGGDLEFPVPGEPGKAYWVRNSDDPRTQYVFLTPIYARFLLSRHDDRLHTFFHKVHDEVRKMIRGEDSVFAVAAEVEATRPQLQLVDEERRLKLRRLEY